MRKFLQNRSDCEPKKLDRMSVRLLENLIENSEINVDDSNIELGGTMPNIDGYFDILDDTDRMEARIHVQIKHLRDKTVEEAAEKGIYYSIPQSILSHAEINKGDVVLFVTCDTINNVVYWKHINFDYIEECYKKCRKKELQKSFTYYFKPDEQLVVTNVTETLKRWKDIYKERQSLITDAVTKVQNFVTLHKQSFNSIRSIFHGIKNSHIHRNETDVLYEWINKDDESKKEGKIKFLIGNAGLGKSVVLKDLINQLDTNNIKVLAIKADSCNVTDDPDSDYSLESLRRNIEYMALGEKKIVLIIDQIDALSSSLSKDREKLNNILNTIITLNNMSDIDIRIVVSCRKYDFEYDAALREFRHYPTVELSKLTEDEVKTIIKNLDKNLPNKLSGKTLKLFTTPQYLDIFCRVYRRNKAEYNFKNHIDLYDELWDDILTSYYTRKEEKGSLEECVYELAKLIHTSDTLSPTVTISERNASSMRYLLSKDIIRKNGETRISFFHQSFYEYIMARYYYEKEDFIQDVINRFQGFETRYNIKLLLEYEKQHNEKLYEENIRNIIFTKGTRFHLKQLALSIISSADDIKPYELKIVADLYDNDFKLLTYFISTTTNESWYDILKGYVIKMLPLITMNSSNYISAVRFMTSYLLKHTEDMYQMKNLITDSETKETITRILLCQHNDYTLKVVRDTYKHYSAHPSINWHFLIEDSIKTNLNFAIQETKKHILNYFLNKKQKNNDDSEEYSLFEVICKKIIEKDSRQALEMISSCFIEITQKVKKKDEIFWYYTNYIFNGYMNQYKAQFFETLEQLLKQHAKEEELIKPIVVRLLSLEEKMSLSLAFETMSENPHIYDSIIKECISTNANIDKYMCAEDFEYYFLEMLKNWYTTLNKKDAEWYQNRLLEYESAQDFLHDKDRTYHELLYWNLWLRKWILIKKTLPAHDLILPLIKQRGELSRRFKGSYVCEERKPSHRIPSAYICGGITSAENYQRYTIKNWETSFDKLSDRSVNKENGQMIDIRVHAEMFGKCVANEPEYFKDFIFKIFKKRTTREIYKISGLEGLLKGGMNPIELLPLLKQLLNETEKTILSYEIENIIKYFTHKDSEFIDDLIPLLIKEIKKPFTRKENKPESDYSNQVNNMLLSALNSTQGRALSILISILAIKERRKLICYELNALSETLCDELKLEVINYIFVKEYYDEKLSLEILENYIQKLGAAPLYIIINILQYYYYNEYEFATEYIQRITSNKKCHKSLAQFYFFGTKENGVEEKCKEGLEYILSLNDEEVIAEIVKTSFKYIDNMDFADISQTILLRYHKDERNKIRQAYIMYCDKLPGIYFNLFATMSKEWEIDEKEYYITDIINYIEKCIATFPSECYYYMKDHGMLKMTDTYNNDKIIRILLGIYKKLKERKDIRIMNEIMDTLDEYMEKGESTLYEAIKDMEQE